MGLWVVSERFTCSNICNKHAQGEWPPTGFSSLKIECDVCIGTFAIGDNWVRVTKGLGRGECWSSRVLP